MDHSNSATSHTAALARSVQWLRRMIPQSRLVRAALAATVLATGCVDGVITTEGESAAPDPLVGAVPQLDGMLVGEYEVIDGYAVFGGDMVYRLDEVQSPDDPVVYGLYKPEPWRWPNATVPYVINSNVDREMVQDAIDHWNDNTNITLRPRRSGDADYVRFRRTSNDGRCQAEFAHKGGEQFVWLGDDCSLGNTIHEIGHTVGVAHEHTRPDREEWVDIVWDNIVDADGDGSVADEQSNFAIYTTGRVYGTYDYGSIMHYGPRAFGNGEITIIPLQAGAGNMGQRTGLSWRDRQGVNWYYSRDNTTVPSCRSGAPKPKFSLLERGQYRLVVQVDVSDACRDRVDGWQLSGVPDSVDAELPYVHVDTSVLPGRTYCYTATTRRGTSTNTATACFDTSPLIIFPGWSL